MIPEVGKKYYFFDDGKTSPSRCYVAKVLRVIPYDECEEILDIYDHDCQQNIPKSLKDIHKEEVDNHTIQSPNLIIGGCKQGEPWLYAKETDFFVECLIPGYDDNNLWFVRTIDRGWFSINIQNSWQSGRLDIDNSIYDEAKEYFDKYYGLGYYDKCIRNELIRK